jgi:omega-amidase
MHIVACQLDIAWEDKAENRQRVQTALSNEPIPARSLIVLPEMFDTGFTMGVDKACDDDGSSRRFLADLATSYQSTVVAGVVTKDADGQGLNQAAVFGPDGKPMVIYTKMHPFTLAGESEHYRAGDAVKVFECEGFKIAPLICYDLRFPERFREAVSQGAEVFIVIANWPSVRAAHWSALLAARAIENQAYVIAVNRVGHDPNQTYPGLSAVIDPQGQIITQADDKPTTLHADLDLDALLGYRKSFPVLDDIREEE